MPVKIPSTALLLIALVTNCLGSERIVGLRFHGNHSISDSELQNGLPFGIGDTVDSSKLDLARQQLLKSGHFETVQILKRYRSLKNTEEVILIVSVKEKVPAGKKVMFFPVLGYTDEYGFTYGGRITSNDLLGVDERISFPLTWGGTRQAAAEFSLPVSLGFADRLLGEGGIVQSENPAFETDDRRAGLGGGFEKHISKWSIGLGADWKKVWFESAEEQFPAVWAGVKLDTRTNPILPHNSIYVNFHWRRHLLAGSQPRASQFLIDFRGYRNLIGRSILAGQVMFNLADESLPKYLKPFLGGAATLRGHSAGQFVGDNLAIASLEIRVPLNRAGSLYRGGLSLFYDIGSSYDKGVGIQHARFHDAVGGGFWIFAFGLGFKLDVGYDLDEEVKVHFSTGFRF